MAIEELEAMKSHYEKVIFGGHSSELHHYMAAFDRVPEVMCSGVVQATHDFRGNLIGNLANLNEAADWLSFALIDTDFGGAAIFSWPANHMKSRHVMNTLDEHSDATLPRAIIRFTFEFFENTYFSPEWWDSLSPVAKANLKERQLREVDQWGIQDSPRRDGCLVDDGVRTVEWSVTGRSTSIKAE